MPLFWFPNRKQIVSHPAFPDGPYLKGARFGPLNRETTLGRPDDADFLPGGLRFRVALILDEVKIGEAFP
jgi:hypothetical protein